MHMANHEATRSLKGFVKPPYHGTFVKPHEEYYTDTYTSWSFPYKYRRFS